MKKSENLDVLEQLLTPGRDEEEPPPGEQGGISVPDGAEREPAPETSDTRPPTRAAEQELLLPGQVRAREQDLSPPAPLLPGSNDAAPDLDPVSTKPTDAPGPPDPDEPAVRKPAPSAAPARPKRRSPAQGKLNEGLSRYRRGDLRGAMRALTQAVNRDKSFPAARAARALAGHALGYAELSAADLRAVRSMEADDPPTWTLRGNARLLDGNVDEAMEDFSLAISENPSSADAYLGRGRAHRRAGDWKSAIEDWSEALRLDPGLGMAYFNRAQAYAASGNPARAVRDTVKALRIHPKAPLPYALLGTIFAQRKDVRRAVRAYSKAIALHPAYSYAYLGRAQVRLSMGRKGPALLDFNAAVRSAPHDFAAYLNRGEAYWRWGERDAALGDFRKAMASGVRHCASAIKLGDRFLEADSAQDAAAAYVKGRSLAGLLPPPLREFLVELASLKLTEAHEKSGSPEEALRVVTEAIRNHPESTTCLTTRGRLYRKLGRDAKASADFDEALRINPDDPQALIERGKLLAGYEQYESALRDFDSALLNSPNHAEAWAQRGLLYALHMARPQQALKDLSMAVALAPQDSTHLLLLGDLLLRDGEFRQALRHYDAAVGLDPRSPDPLRRRAEARASLGDQRGALGDLRAALLLAPKNGEVYRSLGVLRLKAFDGTQALKHLERALELGPETYALRMDLGLANGLAGKNPEAARQFHRAAELEPRSAQAHASLCRALRLQKNPQAALEACGKAVALDPRHGDARIDRGFCHLALRDHRKAADDLAEGMRLGARHGSAELARSVAHAALRQYQESDEAYRSALDIDPSARSVFLGFGNKVEEGALDYHEAIQALDRIAEKDGRDPRARLVLGNALHNAGHLESAVEEYNRALEADPPLAEAYSDRCRARSAQRSLEAAEEDCRKAVELDPKEPRHHARLLQVLAMLRNYERGIEAAVAALRGEAPKTPDIYVEAGNLRYFLRNFRRAQENYALAARADPSWADAHNGIGLCRFAQGRYQDAIDFFSRAVALNPRNDRYYRNRASAYVNLRDYPNAAMDYQTALVLNTDPERASQYRELIRKARASAHPVPAPRQARRSKSR